MSKMDALRAMREAKYEAAQKATQKTQKTGQKPPPARTRPPVAPPAARPAAEAQPEKTDAAQPDALCGHRNMSGRTCTREHGHAAKSHRYS
ncbi:putative membrane protein [Nocardioides salarius]|uniref:Membrane protein n=1 Tax=Nocardioides salarius TaxID=374513 RepID=A0ABS2MDU5_9ACTN|nr:hypothetical protein [Nocardioides salarius]MBM7509297.1 putative membrane protein [Nocardioides salarius]